MRFKTINTMSFFAAIAGVLIACLNTSIYFGATLIASSVVWASTLIASAIYETNDKKTSGE